MSAPCWFERRVRRAGARSAAIFVHGLDGDRERTWGAFPERVGNAVDMDVYSLGWPAKLSRCIADPEYTVPAASVAVALALPTLLAPYERIQLTFHCLGAVMMIGALDRARAAGFALPDISALLLDAPLLTPDSAAPAWLVRAVRLMGLERAALATQARWFHAAHGGNCIVVRGSDAAWVDHCAPFAVGHRDNHTHLSLDHVSLAAAPLVEEHEPLSLALAQLARGAHVVASSPSSAAPVKLG